MLEIKRHCPHCGIEVKCGYKHWGLKPYSWVTCSSCHNLYTFEYFGGYSFLGIFFFVIFLIFIFFLTLLSKIFPVESIFALLIISLLSLRIQSFFKPLLKKVENRKEDGNELKYKRRGYFFSLFVVSFSGVSAIIISLYLDLSYFKIVSSLGKSNELNHVRNIESKIHQDFLDNKDLFRNIRIYSVREKVWKKKCQEGVLTHCRLLSRLSFYDNDFIEEERLLRNACNKNEGFSCMRLFLRRYDDSVQFKKQLVQLCSKSKNSIYKNFCNDFAMDLARNGFLDDSKIIFKQNCLENKKSIACLQLVRFFSVEENLNLHQLICQSGGEVSCEALEFSGIKSSRKISANDNNQNNLDIMRAVQLGLLEKVKSFISKGEDPNRADSNNNTLLHYAVDFENPEMVKLLISNGARVNEMNNFGNTPLMISVMNNKYSEIYNLLLKSGAEINVRNNKNISVLELSASNLYYDFFNELLRKNASLYFPKPTLKFLGLDNFVTRLIKAGNYNRLRNMLDHFGSKLIFEKIPPQELLILAISNGSKKMIEIIIEEMEKNKIDYHSFNDEIMINAHLLGNSEVISYFESLGLVAPKSILDKFRMAIYQKNASELYK